MKNASLTHSFERKMYVEGVVRRGKKGDIMKCLNICDGGEHMSKTEVSLRLSTEGIVVNVLSLWAVPHDGERSIKM